MEMMSWSSSTLIMSIGCCCGEVDGGWVCSSTQPRRWLACARLSAATRALERVGLGWISEDAKCAAAEEGGECGPEVGRRLSATLKQSSRARHWSGCCAGAAAVPGAGWERRQARLSSPYGAAGVEEEEEEKAAASGCA